MGWENKVNNLLDRCVSPAAFGISVTHIHNVGGSQVLNGVWSDIYATTDPEGLSIMSSDPNIGFKVADLDNYPTKSSIIVKSGKRYLVRAIEPDGEGGVTLVLEEEKV